MPDLEHARPSTIRDAAWQTAYRLGFPLARICWRLRRQRHEGALVAVHVGHYYAAPRSRSITGRVGEGSWIAASMTGMASIAIMAVVSPSADLGPWVLDLRAGAPNRCPLPAMGRESFCECRLSCRKSPKPRFIRGVRSMAARARRARRASEQPPSASDEEQVKEEHRLQHQECAKGGRTVSATARHPRGYIGRVSQ
jgi:hypothetical protein